MPVYYYIPHFNGHGDKGFVGSLSKYKIFMLSSVKSNGKVYQCDISEFKGRLLSYQYL